MNKLFSVDKKYPVLETAVRSRRLGLITDFDGTLSPIVPQPDAAMATPGNLAALRQMVEMLPLVAAVSGRAASDLQARLVLPSVVVVGNHGLERWQDGRTVPHPQIAPFRAALLAARDAIAAQAGDGVQIEDKQATLSIHYRNVADPAATAVRLRPIVERAAQENGLQLFPGRLIFELRPPIAVNKGTAFADLVAEFGLEAAVFLGDDVTDVDAMGVAQSLRQQNRCHTVAVGVLSTDTPDGVIAAADLLVEEVAGVEIFLDWLIHAWRAAST